MISGHTRVCKHIPQFQQEFYSVVFAPASEWRLRIIPKEAIPETETAAQEEKTETSKGSHDHKRWYVWDELLQLFLQYTREVV